MPKVSESQITAWRRVDATERASRGRTIMWRMKFRGYAHALGMVLAVQLWGQAPAVVSNPAQLGDRTGKFKAGDVAPDFNLKLMHKEARVALSSFRNQRPVAMVFGSYT